MNQYNCMDLFSGAGGLSLGFADTNRFNILAHIEWEKPMAATLRNALIKRFRISEKETKKELSHLIFKKLMN
nr:DNA cytosine methyltransferase [Helicobacter pylori]